MTSRNKSTDPVAWQQFQGRRKLTEAQIDSLIAEVEHFPRGKVKAKRWNEDGDQLIDVVVERRDELAYRLENASALLAHYDILNSDPSPSVTEKRLRAILSATDELLRKLKMAKAIQEKKMSETPAKITRTRLELPYAQFKNELATSQIRNDLETAIRRFYEVSDKNKAALNTLGELRPAILPKSRIVRRRGREILVDSQEIFADSILVKCVHTVELLASITSVAIKENSSRKTTGKTGKNAPHKGDPALVKYVACLRDIYYDLWEREPGFSRPAPLKRGGAYGPFIRFVSCCLGLEGIDKQNDAIARIVGELRKKQD